MTVLDDRVTAALAELAGRLSVTVNTVVQAAWAIVLGKLTGRSEVVFGATVSGRPAQVPGIEQMVGLFINTIPVRVGLDPAESIETLLQFGSRASRRGCSSITSAAGATSSGPPGWGRVRHA